MRTNNQVFTNIPLDELLKIISDAVTIAMKNNTYPSNASGNEKPLSRKEAAEFLSVDPNTISRYYYEGRIDGAVINRKIYFQKSALIALLENHN